MHILIYSQCLLQKLAFTYNKLLTKVLTDLDVHGININTSQTTEWHEITGATIYTLSVKLLQRSIDLRVPDPGLGL